MSAMNQGKNMPNPWTLSYSFGRVLQEGVLETWGGREENVKPA